MATGGGIPSTARCRALGPHARAAWIVTKSGRAGRSAKLTCRDGAGSNPAAAPPGAA